MNKILAKEYLSGNIRLSIGLRRILTAHDFDMRNVSLQHLKKITPTQASGNSNIKEVIICVTIKNCF